MKISNLTFLGLLFLFSYVGLGQTYKVIKVELKCQTTEIKSKLNSEDNDFSPFVYGDKIYFVSDRNPDVFMEGENNWKELGCVNIFQADIKGAINAETKMNNIRLFSERFYNGNHTGPINFSSTGDSIFISQVNTTGKGKGPFYPQLFFSIKSKKTYSKPLALPFNNPKYSFSHPFYDSETKRLYFSSNMPGGKGGKDIYYSQLSENVWSDPISVEEINTKEDEMFPFIANKIFFFSSTSKKKKEGLDIYWKLMDGMEDRTLLEGANSTSDDFGIFVFPGLTKGYLSSNRNGKDDLYYFDMEYIVTVRNEMVGEFRYKKLKGEAANIKVQIIDENDFVLYETTTDEEGRFIFKEIDYDKPYLIKAVSEEELELTLKNKNGENVVDLLADENNVFVFRRIGYENSGTLSLIPDDMIDFNLNVGHLSGQLIYDDKPNEYPSDLKIVLMDGNGNESLFTNTNEMGNFDFKNLSMDKNYTLTVPDSEDNMILFIYDLKGNVVAQLKTNSLGEFTFRKIKPEHGNNLKLMEIDEIDFEIISQTVWGYFEYNNSPLLSRENLSVGVYDENGNLINKVLTDKDGVFRFRNLPTDKTLLFKLEENGDNFILDDFKLYVFDREKQKIAGLKRGQDDFFTFRPLGYEKNNQLSQIEENYIDFILGSQQSRKNILVYFDSNKENVKKSDMRIVNNIYTVLKDNPSTKMEINAYTDSRSSDEYNLILSEKRGQWIVDFLIHKGISSDRFIVNAYGETRLVDSENDALNRRAEIHLYE